MTEFLRNNFPHRGVCRMTSNESEEGKCDFKYSTETHSYTGCLLQSIRSWSWYKPLIVCWEETFHTRRGKNHARLTTESPSSCPLPISNNFQHQQTITTCLLAQQICLTKPESRMQRKETGGEITLAAAREWITKRTWVSKKCSACLVIWPLSKCFPVTVWIVFCWETKGCSLLTTVFKLCTSAAEVTQSQRAEGNLEYRLLL